MRDTPRLSWRKSEYRSKDQTYPRLHTFYPSFQRPSSCSVLSYESSTWRNQGLCTRMWKAMNLSWQHAISSFSLSSMAWESSSFSLSSMAWESRYLKIPEAKFASVETKYSLAFSVSIPYSLATSFNSRSLGFRPTTWSNQLKFPIEISSRISLGQSSPLVDLLLVFSSWEAFFFSLTPGR